MPKRKTYVLPASGHNLWVAFFDPALLNGTEEQSEIPEILEVHPVVGWIYTHLRDEVEPAFELTPDGPVLPGIARYLRESREEAREAGFLGLSAEWDRRRARKAENATGLTGTGVPVRPATP